MHQQYVFLVLAWLQAGIRTGLDVAGRTTYAAHPD